MLFSVIIPVYQAEKTITRCIDSLVSQAEDDVEILLVDDGSTDKSPLICDRFAADYANVRCIHQNNQGVSAARNAALEQAQGTYLLFVDSDDHVASNYFAVLRRELNRERVDMLVFGYSSKEELLGTDSGIVAVAETPHETAVLFSELLRAQYLGSLWTKVFRREIVDRHHIRFMPNLRIAEDLTYIFTYLLHATGIRRIGDRLYFYAVNNSDSLSKKNRAYLADHLLKANDEMRTQLCMRGVCYRSADLAIIERALIRNYYRNAYTSIRELEKFDETEKEKRKKKKEICKKFSRSEWKPKGLSNTVMAFPIRHRMVRTIDSLMKVLIK